MEQRNQRLVAPRLLPRHRRSPLQKGHDRYARRRGCHAHRNMACMVPRTEREENRRAESRGTRSADGSGEGSMVIVDERDLHDGGTKLGSRGRDEKNEDSVRRREKADREDVKEKEPEDVDA